MTTTTPAVEAPAPSWMIVELMGYQRMAGEVTEVTVAGKGFLRIDVPASEREPAFTRFVSPDSVYALNPCTEEVARRAAAAFRPKVVNEWELPRALPPASPSTSVVRCVECGETIDEDEVAAASMAGLVCSGCLEDSLDDGDGDQVGPDEESHLAAAAAASEPRFELSADDNQARPRRRCTVRGCLEQLFSDEEERAGVCTAHLAQAENA